MNKKLFELQADFFKTLAHPLRMEVISILETHKELCFTDILEITGGLKSNLSQHLSLMTRQGLMNMRREGQCNYYALASEKMPEVCRLVQEMLVKNIQERSDIVCG